MCGRCQFLAALSTNFEVQSHRFCPEAADIHADFQQLIEPCNTMKVALEMHTRQPDLQLIEHHSIMKANFSEEFCFSKLKEVNVSAIEDDARSIDIAPAHTLFNSECFVRGHLQVLIDRVVQKTH